MKKYPKVSIIIPVIKVNNYVLESMPKILELDWPDFEIILVTDKADKKHKWPKTKNIVSGKVGPAEKRDLAAEQAKGEILAFLDDDAYPEPDWLMKMVHCFEDKKVGAVGGPAITPDHDGVLQKVSGAVFESYLGGGFARNRYLPLGDHCDCDDWPTVNLLVLKDVFMSVDGFDNTYWPGEDTKLCLDIVDAGYTIKYDPEGIVYHHRRSDLIKHFKQIGSYALHRGYFAKKYPKTSLKIGYFAPTAFTIYIVILLYCYIDSFLGSSLLHSFTSPVVQIMLIPLAIYIMALFVDFLVVSIRWKNPLVGLITLPMIFLTHIWYGIRFVQGLLTSKLKK